MEQRVSIAIEILNTICALQSSPTELEKFIVAITNAPLEEVNEFRYISTQRRFEFFVEQEKYRVIKSQIIQNANEVLRNPSLPVNLKKDIYFNTIIRKVYDLQEACRQFGNELYASTADEPFVLALKFEEKCEDAYYFTTKGSSNTIYSQRRFVYRGPVKTELVPNYIYLVTLKNYDFEERCFTLSEIDLTNEQTDQWNKFRRKVRDMKKVTHNAELAKIKSDLQSYNVRITSKHHIQQLTHDLNLIFKRNNYGIEAALGVIDVISEKNPFAGNGKDYSEFKEAFAKDYAASYEEFLKDYKENYKSAMGFCDFFFASYLKAFVDYSKFVDDIVDEKNTRTAIVDYCKYKGYITE